MSKPLNADQLFNAALKIYETNLGDNTLEECVQIAIELRQTVDLYLQRQAEVPAAATPSDVPATTNGPTLVTV